MQPWWSAHQSHETTVPFFIDSIHIILHLSFSLFHFYSLHLVCIYPLFPKPLFITLDSGTLYMCTMHAHVLPLDTYISVLIHYHTVFKLACNLVVPQFEYCMLSPTILFPILSLLYFISKSMSLLLLFSILIYLCLILLT